MFIIKFAEKKTDITIYENYSQIYTQGKDYTKEAEILRERLSLAQEVNPYVGKYYSIEYIRKNVLRQSDEDIIDIDNQIADEIKQGIIIIKIIYDDLNT